MSFKSELICQGTPIIVCYELARIIRANPDGMTVRDFLLAHSEVLAC